MATAVVTRIVRRRGARLTEDETWHLCECGCVVSYNEAQPDECPNCFAELDFGGVKRTTREASMKFRKKPVVIDAVQFETGTTPQGVCRCLNSGREGLPHIHTLEGIMDVYNGDWIITGIKGEQYPCKPDIFALTYEEVRSD